jgi:CPA2 family monovalent cation:H+ antiporter-2
MHDIRFIFDLAIALGTAAVIALLFRRLKLPVVFGYLIAGILVGPIVPIPLEASVGNIQIMSELGVILIMFGIGLEFNIKKVIHSGMTAIMMASVQACFIIAMGIAVSRALGWSSTEAIFVGSAMVATSTVVIVKLFEELPPSRALRRIVFPVTIQHDLIAIILMTLLTAYAKVGAKGFQVSYLWWTFAKLGLFLVVVVGLGRYFIPRLLHKLADHEKSENLVIASIAFCFCIAALAAVSGFSFALGAFVAGMLASESGKEGMIEKLITPMRDVFTSMFFVAIGMMIIPSAIVANINVILLFVLVVVVANAVSLTVAGIFTGQTFHNSFQTGIVLGQFGEFAFVIMTIGIAAGIVRPELFSIMVSVAVITAFTSSLLFKHSARMADAIESRFPEILRTSIALYQVWLKSLSTRGIHKGEGASLKRPVIFIFLDCLVILATFIIYRIMLDSSPNLFNFDPWGQVLLRTTLAIILGVVTAFLISGILKQSSVLARRLAIMAPNPETIGSRGRRGRHFLAGGIKIATLAIVGLPMITLMQAFIPSGPLFFVTLSVLVLVVLTQIYRTRKISRDMPLGTEWLLTRIFEASQLQAEISVTTDRTGTFRILKLDPECPNLGYRLSQLDFAGRLGVTVVALLRQGHNTIPLHPSPTLQSGDRIVLAGPERALYEARIIMTECFYKGKK